jgi:hypothetical protein
MSREIMQQALDAFEDLKAFATDNGAMPENWDAYYPKQYDALEALRQALAQPERECDVHECRRKVREADDDSSLAGSPIYRR